MKKLLILLLFLPLIVLGNKAQTIDKNFNLTYEWILAQPKSYAKDFFIIEYLKKDTTTKSEATKLFSQARNKNGRLKVAYNKKFSDIPKDELRCYSLQTSKLLKEDNKCLALGLTLLEATKLSKQQLQKAIKKVDEYPTLRNDLKVIASKKIKKELLKTSIYRYYRLFFKTSKKFRTDKFNFKMPNYYINNLSQHKDFNKYVRYIVTNDKLNKLQESLFYVKNSKNLNTQTLFFLGINALKHYKTSIALKYINYSYKRAYYQIDKDRALFWKVLIKKDLKTLEKLANSWDNNIYSLYAKELLNIPIENIIYDVKQKELHSNFISSNQFEWIKVIKDTKKVDDKKLEKYSNIFTTKDTLPHYVYVLSKYHMYKKQYYITPYKKTMSNFDLDRQVLIYSLARQESYFIPSSISSATALGVMQIMPFLSNSISKKLGDEYNIFEQFNARKSIEYANFHLDGLEKRFKHPLLIAYAYNGGPGYARSILKKGLFKKKRKFEPFLSMELVSYNETRRYGKKVLANYYIYSNYLKKSKTTLKSIFQNLLK